MANELTLSVNLKWVEGDVTVQRTVSGLRINTAGVRHYDAVQQIAITAGEAISVPADTGVGGYMMLENLDATNFISVSAATPGSAPLIKLLPGDIALFRLTAAAPFAIADTAVCNMRVTLIPL